MVHLILVLFSVIVFQPIHEFHTSLMTMSYEKESRAFEIEIEVDTEHFEQVINEVYETDIHLGESNEIEDCNDFIEAYLNETLFLKINKKIVGLSVEKIEVDYALTIITLEPIKHKRRVKSINLENTYMLEKFPTQKNLVHIFYKDQKRSLLFDSQITEEKVSF